MADHFPEREEVRRELEARVQSASSFKRARWRLGRRGAFLVMMGALYVVLGYSYGFGDLPTFTRLQLAGPIDLALLIPGCDSVTMSLHIWGVLWLASGLVAFVTAWWPPGKDHIGFHALWIFSSVWAVLNICGQLFLDAPRAGVMGLIFGIYAATVLIVSGMVDPTPIVKVVAEDDALRDHR